MALIFIGAFLAATLFSFFWIDTFFARGIAEVRSLFRWMPLLLVFLVAALTMRQWSEEQQTGTLEILLTLPVRAWQLVLGKFISVLILVLLALALTLGLPFTVNMLGDLDWGPVIGGYVAAILMAAAYIAIGLFISSRTDNQIVALMLTAAVCGLFYFIGTRGLTDFFGEQIGSILRALSTSSRFESIERGVIDIRDLVYYLSLALLFLSLNVLSLDSKRWSLGHQTANYRFNANLVPLLLAINLVLTNLWLYPMNGIRVDLTEDQQYTLSDTTKDLLGTLREPLLLRAYFSERTHPLLAPLVPRIRDMLNEYEVAGGNTITVEVVDPAQNPELEAEAAQSYSIRPTPFQVAGRYESGLVNAYFDILVRYGDQSEVLNFRDLIEVEPFRDGEVDVRLRNLEYDLTRAIKKTVFGFQNIEDILAGLPDGANLTLYITPDTLPEDLAEVRGTIESVANDLTEESGGQFTLSVVNPLDPNSGVTPQQLLDTYNMQPFATDFFSNETFYLHMLLQAGEDTALIYPSGDMTESDVRTSIESTLKRASPGFLKVVGTWTPVIGPDPTMAQFGQTQQPPFSTWNTMSQQLGQEYEVRPVDLSSGQVPADIDVLVVVAPQGMDDVARFAIDQYLMRGGSLLVAGSTFRPAPDPFTGALALQPIEGGLRDMLLHYGVDVQQTLVLDPQNEPFPIQVQRQVGGFTVQEIQSLPYPYFVDVRSDGMSSDSAIIANLPTVTMNWVSPVVVDQATNTEREVMTLLSSTEQSWTSSSLEIQPNTDLYPDLGFAVGAEQASHPLAVSIQGSFVSFFQGKENPLANLSTEPDPQTGQPAASAPAVTGMIEESPATARLIVIGSGDFLNDTVFQISGQISLDRYLNSLQFVQNSVDWSTEDLDLLTIRSRGTYARLLDPLAVEDQSFWEYLNYGIALIALLIIGLLWASGRQSERPMRLMDPPKGMGDVAAGAGD